MTTLNPFPPLPSGSGNDYVESMNSVISAVNNIVTPMNNINSEADALVVPSNENRIATQADATECLAVQNRMEPLTNYKGPWDILTGPLPKPACVLHHGQIWKLLENLNDVTSYEPSEEFGYWELFDNPLVNAATIDYVFLFDSNTVNPPNQYVSSWTIPADIYEVQIHLQGGGASGGIGKGWPGSTYFTGWYGPGNAGDIIIRTLKVNPGDVLEFWIGLGGNPVSGTSAQYGSAGQATRLYSINGILCPTNVWQASGGSPNYSQLSGTNYANNGRTNQQSIKLGENAFGYQELIKNGATWKLLQVSGGSYFSQPIVQIKNLFDGETWNGIDADIFRGSALGHFRFGISGTSSMLSHSPSPSSVTSGRGCRGCVLITYPRGGY